MAVASYQDLADLLSTAGAVVGGGAALVGTMAFVGAAIARDAGLPIDPLKAAERGAAIGGVLGVAAFAYRIAGVR